MNVQNDHKGVLIRRIEPTAPVNKILNKGDIVLSFDGVDIANDGTVPFRSGERISFNYLVSKKYSNEEVSICYEVELSLWSTYSPAIVHSLSVELKHSL